MTNISIDHVVQKIRAEVIKTSNWFINIHCIDPLTSVQYCNIGPKSTEPRSTGLVEKLILI